MAQENKVIAPYVPIEVNQNVISILGRKLELNADGFPKQIQTFFNEEMTGITSTPNNELSEPLHFHFIRSDDSKDLAWNHQGIQFTNQEPGKIQWTALNFNDTLRMEVAASLEFDGFVSYQVKVTALEDIDFKDIALHIAFNKEAAKYMMGLGQKEKCVRTVSLGNGMWQTRIKMAHGLEM